jgi:hypothetical protein
MTLGFFGILPQFSYCVLFSLFCFIEENTLSVSAYLSLFQYCHVTVSKRTEKPDPYLIPLRLNSRVV